MDRQQINQFQHNSMGQSHTYRPWKDADPARICKIRGRHNPRRYGDGVFCSDCEEPCFLPENGSTVRHTVKIHDFDNGVTLLRCLLCGPTMDKEIHKSTLIHDGNLSEQIEARYAEFQNIHEHPEPKIYRPAPKAEWFTHLMGH